VNSGRLCHSVWPNYHQHSLIVNFAQLPTTEHPNCLIKGQVRGSVIRMSRLLPALVLGHEKVLEWVLQSNQRGDVNEPDKTGQTVLTWAIKYSLDEVI
jgi:hypothetical protein